jgi:hypothetical protein
MPDYSADIHILHPVTVNVDFIILCQALDLLSHATLGSVALIQERRDDSERRL